MSGKTCECLGGEQESRERAEASQASCPVMPRERLLVPNYFPRVFMNISHNAILLQEHKAIRNGVSDFAT